MCYLIHYLSVYGYSVKCILVIICCIRLVCLHIQFCSEAWILMRIEAFTENYQTNLILVQTG
jgi:hypothetical protein